MRWYLTYLVLSVVLFIASWGWQRAQKRRVQQAALTYWDGPDAVTGADSFVRGLPVGKEDNQDS